MYLHTVLECPSCIYADTFLYISVECLGSYSSVVGGNLHHAPPMLTPSLVNYVRSDLTSHVNGWPADILEKQVTNCVNVMYQQFSFLLGKRVMTTLFTIYRITSFNIELTVHMFKMYSQFNKGDSFSGLTSTTISFHAKCS